jgi:hypothetical protein
MSLCLFTTILVRKGAGGGGMGYSHCDPSDIYKTPRSVSYDATHTNSDLPSVFLTLGYTVVTFCKAIVTAIQNFLRLDESCIT